MALKSEGSFSLQEEGGSIEGEVVVVFYDKEGNRVHEYSMPFESTSGVTYARLHNAPEGFSCVEVYVKPKEEDNEPKESKSRGSTRD